VSIAPSALSHRILPLLALGLPLAAQATNGYSPTGFGTTNKGLAGAGVALPQDSLAAATNPAGMVRLGERLDLGAAVFLPNRRFVARDDGNPPPFPSIPTGRYDSKNDIFLVPAFGWNHRLNDRSTIGVSIGGNGGMNTEYDVAVWQNFAPPGVASKPTGVDLGQVFMGLSYAYQITPQHSLGIMPILAYQRFKAEGLEPFDNPAASVSPGHVTNRDYDNSWGYGARIGWLGQVTPRLSLGLSYQTKLYMSKFDKYRGLFAEQGNFDIPATLAAGLAFKATPSLTLLFDYQRIYYGDVKALHNSNNINPFANPALRMGADDGLGFGWDDQDIYKFGVQWEYSPELTLRAGYSHATQVFDNAQALFNILAPATIRDHASLGLTYRFNPKNAISVAYTHAFKEKVEGQNTIFTGPQTGYVEMDQDGVEISWNHWF